MAKLTRKYPICEAEQALIDYFNTLGITATTKKIGGFVENDWPHVKFIVTFTKNSLKIELPFSVGIGHANFPNNHWRCATNSVFNDISENEARIIDLIKKNKTPKDAQTTAYLAAKFTSDDTIIPAYVFANALRDFPETDFSEWCAEFDYNNDSIKAKSIYDKCLEYGYAAKKFINKEQESKLIELVYEI